MPDVGGPPGNSNSSATPLLERRQSAPIGTRHTAFTPPQPPPQSANAVDMGVSSPPPPSSATSDEFVCYGDRVCFLCEGQLLALTRKFNLTYQQMVVLGLLTLCSGGLFGAAGLLIWKKGVLRKRYAALFSDAIYADDDSAESTNKPANTGIDTGIEDHARSLVTQASTDGTIYSTNLQPTTARADATDDASTGSIDPRKPVTFRIFAYDASTQTIDFSSVGQPVRFGTSVVVVHAATLRAIKYKTHRGAVTLSKPLKHLHFQRDVHANVESLKTSSMFTSIQLPQKHKKKTPNDRLTALLPARMRSRTVDSDNTGELEQQPIEQQPPRSLPIALDIASARRPSNSNRRMRRPQSEQTRTLTTRATMLAPETQAPVAQAHPERLYRRFSESCVTLAHDITDTINDARQRRLQRDAMRATDDKKRLKQLIKELPNMSFANSSGKYFVATIEPVRHRSAAATNADNTNVTIARGNLQTNDLSTSSATLNSTLAKKHNGSQMTITPVLRATNSSVTTGSFEHPLAADVGDHFLRWGAPMAVVAQHNRQACGIQPRQYYKDCQLYLTTESSQATIIPLREDGDLQSMAKESTRLLAHVEKRSVTLSVGTYNVWMMPRIVSAFTSVSPKKNTRARLIADVLPPCDVWVFTECFDHRARAQLLDKLQAAGYFYLSPTVGHKRLKRENMRKVLNGGVVVASKFPIVTVRIKLFKEACLGADKLADKGVLYCKILKDGLPVHVFSTHLQAWSDPASRAMRKTQMLMLATFIKHVGGIDALNDPVLIVGDLNVNFWRNKVDQEYDEMLQLFNASDPSLVALATNGTNATLATHLASVDETKPMAPSATNETNETNTTNELTATHEPLGDETKLPTNALTAVTAALARRLLDPKRARQFSFDPRLNALAADGLSTDGSLELLDFVLVSKAHRQPATAKSWIVPLTSPTPWMWRNQPQHNLSDHYPVVSAFTFDM